VQHVVVEADRLHMQTMAASRRGLDKQQTEIADGVFKLSAAARAAALREDPRPRRFQNWWRGILVEAAYLNLHTARAQIVDLYDENELRAEIPTALARAQATMHRDDPRRTTAEKLLRAENLQVERARPVLRRLISDSYEKADLEHAQLRSFRNILLLSALSILVLIAATVAVVVWHPDWMPMCFDTTNPTGKACPTSHGATATGRGADIIMVALLGALGGALTASLSIRNLKGTSTPYDVPVALAMLKVPLGAFTAILALVAIHGSFVPGLTNLDSQEQILAYALVFGFAQQALSRLLDQRAQTLMEGLPGGTSTEPSPPPPAAPVVPAEPAPAGGEGKKEGAEPGGEEAELAPSAQLPEDVDLTLDTDALVPAAATAAAAGTAGEPVPTAELPAEDTLDSDDLEAAGRATAPMQPPEKTADPALLPDEDNADFFEDDKAESAAGPDAGDGVVYPTGEAKD